MQAPPEFGFEQLVTELLRGLADAVADRPAQTEAQRFARHRTAIFSVMAMLPRDAMEAMLAGQCVMFDHLLRDATGDLLRSEAAPGKLRIRSQVTALGRLFLQHLEHFCRLRARSEQQPAASARAEPEPSPDPAHMPEPGQTTADAGQPTDAVTEPTAVPEQSWFPGDSPASQPPAEKVAQLSQRGFQNRRMRRALQFKKPAGKAASRRSAQIATAPPPAARSGL